MLSFVTRTRLQLFLPFSLPRPRQEAVVPLHTSSTGESASPGPFGTPTEMKAR